MARYLVVANLTTESPTLRVEAARILEDDPNASFDVIVPMVGMSPSLERFSAVDSLALRRERALRARRRLASVGARDVAVHLANLQPLAEIDAVLREGGFAAVIVSTLPRRLSRWTKTELPGQISRRHPEVEVRVITAPADLYEDSVRT